MIKFTEQSVSLLETIDKDLKLVLNRTNKKKLWSRFILNLEVLYNKYVILCVIVVSILSSLDLLIIARIMLYS